MLISNKSSHTIHVEVIPTLRSPEIKIQTLGAGDTDDFKVECCIRIYSEIGTCLAINYFGTEIKDIRNFGNLVLEEGPRKNSGISIIISEK